MKGILVILYTVLSGIKHSSQVCINEIPLSSGSWNTSSRGVWEINDAHDTITGFTVTTNTVEGPFETTMKCDNDVTDLNYILFKSSRQYYLFGGFKYIYVCIRFEQQQPSDSGAFFFYFGSSKTTLAEGVYERIILLPTATTFDFVSLCNEQSTDPSRANEAIRLVSPTTETPTKEDTISKEWTTAKTVTVVVVSLLLLIIAVFIAFIAFHKFSNRRKVKAFNKQAVKYPGVDIHQLPGDFNSTDNKINKEKISPRLYLYNITEQFPRHNRAPALFPLKRAPSKISSKEIQEFNKNSESVT